MTFWVEIAIKWKRFSFHIWMVISNPFLWFPFNAFKLCVPSPPMQLCNLKRASEREAWRKCISLFSQLSPSISLPADRRQRSCWLYIFWGQVRFGWTQKSAKFLNAKSSQFPNGRKEICRHYAKRASGRWWMMIIEIWPHIRCRKINIHDMLIQKLNERIHINMEINNN